MCETNRGLLQVLSGIGLGLCLAGTGLVTEGGSEQMVAVWHGGSEPDIQKDNKAEKS